MKQNRWPGINRRRPTTKNSDLDPNIRDQGLAFILRMIILSWDTHYNTQLNKCPGNEMGLILEFHEVLDISEKELFLSIYIIYIYIYIYIKKDIKYI